MSVDGQTSRYLYTNICLCDVGRRGVPLLDCPRRLPARIGAPVLFGTDYAIRYIG